MSKALLRPPRRQIRVVPHGHLRGFYFQVLIKPSILSGGCLSSQFFQVLHHGVVGSLRCLRLQRNSYNLVEGYRRSLAKTTLLECLSLLGSLGLVTGSACPCAVVGKQSLVSEARIKPRSSRLYLLGVEAGGSRFKITFSSQAKSFLDEHYGKCEVPGAGTRGHFRITIFWGSSRMVESR